MNKTIISIALSVLMMFAFSASANSFSLPLVGDTALSSKAKDSILLVRCAQKDSTFLAAEQSIEKQKKKKRINAFFAFPFPFGFVGAHRVMLGTKPWVPVVYVATFGGCFGLLPLIDFCVIYYSKDITQYEDNPNVFMWLK